MGEHSKIEWCDHTWNPWIGCSRVSSGCSGCYAEGMGKRWGVSWGPGAPRRRTADSTWRQPFAWDRKAAKMGLRYRVFCASLADVFDPEVPDAWRDEAFAVMALTPNINWLLLTKRPEVMREYIGGSRRAENGYPMPPIWHIGMTRDEPMWQDTMTWPLPNVGLGVSVEDQATADARIPHLLETPAALRFVSAEPLLGGLDLYGGDPDPRLGGVKAGPGLSLEQFWLSDGTGPYPGIDWVIAGGESGPRARPMHPDWARSLRDQCAAAGVPFFFKGWGEWAPRRPAAQTDCFDARRTKIVKPSGAVSSGLSSYRDDAWVMDRLGKRAAGRLLDGVEHNGTPEVSHA